MGKLGRVPPGSAPFLFLLAAIVGGLFTVNALRPARRWWPLVGAGFFASWLTAELAAHHILWSIVATAAFLWAGALVGWPGWTALGLMIGCWIGLVILVAEARKARLVMEAALREGLGDDYLAAIEKDQHSLLEEAFPVRQRLLPLWMGDSRVERVRNIVYHRAEGVSLRLDVYRPRERRGPCPVVLHVHGGAWMIGSKDDQGKPLAYRLASHGWVVVSINYRLSPRFTWPAHIVDVKAAIKWIREHGAEYGADPDFIAITGGSAGGHLSALAALTPGDPEYQPGFERADTTVQACVPFYGVYDFTDRKGIWKRSLLRPMLERRIMKRRLSEAPDVFERASPMSRVSPGAPPFFVIHGTRDTLVPVAEARLFVELLRASSRSPVLYAELPGAQHAFEVFASHRTGLVLAGVERFLAWTLGEWRARRRAAAPVSVPDRAEAASDAQIDKVLEGASAA